MRKSPVLLLVCAFVLLAFSANASAAAKARPIHGYVVGTITYSGDSGAPPPAPPYLWAAGDAVGDVSHMGETVMWCQNPVALDFLGDGTLTAANGDTVTYTYYGGGDLPDPGEWYDVWSVFTLTGGTGRFAGATGKLDGTMHTQFLPAAAIWPAIWEFSGTVTY